MKDNKIPWIRNEYPLVDERLTRNDCAAYLERRHPDIKVGKSACVICPYHDDASWKRLAEEHPQDFAYAVKVDRSLRLPGHPEYDYEGGRSFLHRLRVPLDEAVRMIPDTPSLFDGFGNDCSGHCGV